MRALKRHARSLNITVQFDEDFECVWIPRIRTIRIESGLSQSDTIACFLHELGHVIDDLSRYDEKERAKVEIAYGMINNAKKYKKYAAVVCQVEENAWRIGRSVANFLKIELGVWYDDAHDYYISTYTSLKP